MPAPVAVVAVAGVAVARVGFVVVAVVAIVAVAVGADVAVVVVVGANATGVVVPMNWRTGFALIELPLPKRPDTLQNQPTLSRECWPEPLAGVAGAVVLVVG